MELFPLPNLLSVLTKEKGLEWTWRNKSLSSLLPSGGRVGKPKRLWSLLHLTCTWALRGTVSPFLQGMVREQACSETAVKMNNRLHRNHCRCTPFHKASVPCSSNAPTARRSVEEEKRVSESLASVSPSMQELNDMYVPGRADPDTGVLKATLLLEAESKRI